MITAAVSIATVAIGHVLFVADKLLAGPAKFYNIVLGACQVCRFCGEIAWGADVFFVLATMYM